MRWLSVKPTLHVLPHIPILISLVCLVLLLGHGLSRQSKGQLHLNAVIHSEKEMAAVVNATENSCAVSGVACALTGPPRLIYHDTDDQGQTGKQAMLEVHWRAGRQQGDTILDAATKQIRFMNVWTWGSDAAQQGQGAEIDTPRVAAEVGFHVLRSLNLAPNGALVKLEGKPVAESNDQLWSEVWLVRAGAADPIHKIRLCLDRFNGFPVRVADVGYLHIL